MPGHFCFAEREICQLQVTVGRANLSLKDVEAKERILIFVTNDAVFSLREVKAVRRKGLPKEIES